MNTVAGVNTRDALHTVDDLAALLTDANLRMHGLLSSPSVDRARTLRAALRAILATDNTDRVVTDLNALLGDTAPNVGIHPTPGVAGWYWSLGLPPDSGPVRRLQLLTTSSILATSWP